MLKHMLYFLAIFVVFSILNFTLPFYDQGILGIIGLSLIATFFNWLVNLPTSKKDKSGEG